MNNIEYELNGLVPVREGSFIRYIKTEDLGNEPLDISLLAIRGVPRQVVENKKIGVDNSTKEKNKNA